MNLSSRFAVNAVRNFREVTKTLHEYLLLTRQPPSMKTVYAMNALLPELQALLDRVVEEAEERELDLLEFVHVHGWILDRVVMNLTVLRNRQLALMYEVHAKEIKDPKNPFWRAREKAVKELHRRLAHADTD